MSFELIHGGVGGGVVLIDAAEDVGNIINAHIAIGGEDSNITFNGIEVLFMKFEGLKLDLFHASILI